MWIKIVKNGLSNDYESKSKWMAAIFIAVGGLIFLYALFSQLAISSILGVALTAVGLMSAYLTAKINPKTAASWSKALLIVLTGLIFLFGNMTSLSAVSLLIGSFLMLKTANDLCLAYLTRKDSTAYAWSAHALITALFALDILLHTSTISLKTIALYVAFNLMMDGLVLLYSGRKIYIRP